LICVGLWAAIVWFIREFETTEREEATKKAKENVEEIGGRERDEKVEVKKEHQRGAGDFRGAFGSNYSCILCIDTATFIITNQSDYQVNGVCNKSVTLGVVSS
jgi:hypothetical protein